MLIPVVEKKARQPSPYNNFMKKELAKVKKDNPKLDHKEAFKVAANNVIFILIPM